MQKGSGLILVLTGILVVVLIGGGGYWAYKNKSVSSKPPFASQKECEQITKKNCSLNQCQVSEDSNVQADWCKYGFYPYEPSPEPDLSDETANWKIYKNEKIGITFKYPGWHLRSEDISEQHSVVDFAILGSEYEFIKANLNIYSRPSINQTNKTKLINGITWYMVTPNKDQESCDAMECGILKPIYYTFKNDYIYSFYYPIDSSSLMEEVLGTFRFLK